MPFGNFKMGLLGAVAAILVVFFAIFSPFVQVDSGTVKVPLLWGKVQDKTYGEGLHLVNPLYSFEEYQIRRLRYEASGPERIDVLAADSTKLGVEAIFAFTINADMAPMIRRFLGDEDRYYTSLIVPAARSAARDAAAKFPWRDAATVRRDDLASAMTEEFKAKLIVALTDAKFSEEQARNLFSISEIQLRAVMPPEKVQNAIAEKVAAEEDLERQKTLTAIAEAEAQRRKNEGMGVAKLFEELPKGFTPEQIATVLNSLATKQNADAAMKLVESGQVGTIIWSNGGSTPQPAIAPGSPATRPMPQIPGGPAR